MANEQQQNQQHISNTGGNEGAQGIFYGDVHIHISTPPATPHNPHTPAAPERQAQIELFSKGQIFTSTTATTPRSIDWSRFFVWNGGPTVDNVWGMVVEPDLARLREELGASRVQRVLLYPRLHSGLGFAVGYTLNYVRLTVEQPFRDAPTQMWAADAPASNTTQIDVEPEKGGDPAGDVLIELSISRDIGPSIDEWLKRTEELPLRRRVRITPPGGAATDSVPDNAHATAFARQIGKVLRTEHDRAPGATINLFAALPLGLEILIGLQLNACEPIQVYGFHNSDQRYYKFYRLG